MKLEKVRLAFNDLFKKGTYEGQETSYGATFLIPPGHPCIPQIKAAIKKTKAAKWGNKPVRLVRDNPLRDCEEKADLAGYEEGWFFLKANSNTRPTVLNRRRDRIDEDDPQAPYSGCWVNAIIDFYAQDNRYGKAINVSLGGVQFVSDDEAFAGGRAASEDDFDDLEDAEDTEAEADLDYLS
jgi:hypothetical protein